jgi:hypothetical protein
MRFAAANQAAASSVEPRENAGSTEVFRVFIA